MRSETLDKLKEAQKLKLEGLSYSQIGSRCGVSHATVIHYFQRGNGKSGPGQCAICGNYSQSLHRHHPNYEHLNQIDRICNQCHLSLHNQERIKKGFEAWSKLSQPDRVMEPCGCCWGTGIQLDHEQLGCVARSIRRDRHDSLHKTARRLGVSASYLCLLERGKRRWTKDIYLKAMT